MDLDEIKPSGDPIKDALIKSRSVYTSYLMSQAQTSRTDATRFFLD